METLTPKEIKEMKDRADNFVNGSDEFDCRARIYMIETVKKILSLKLPLVYDHRKRTKT